MKRRYTSADIAFIRANYKKHPDSKFIAAQLQRSHGAIQVKISKMGIAIPTRIEFTPDEILFLRRHYMQMTNAQLARRLGKKKTIVRMKLYELHMQRMKELPWTKAEDKILLKHWRTTGDTDISRMLRRRTKGGVRKRRITLGLIRTPDQVNNIVEANKPRFLKHSFKPGHKTVNNNPAKAWETRRLRELSPDYVFMEIQKREGRRA